ILLDATTSFGTRLWSPFSSDRVAWDLLFIIDFAFTAIVLVPQVAAWVFRDNEKARRRGWWMWALFNVGAFAGWALARALGFPFHLWILGIVAAVFALVFLVPLAGGAGFAISQERWCQAGTVAALVYIAMCFAAHQVALGRVNTFATKNHLDIVHIGAIPS